MANQIRGLAPVPTRGLDHPSLQNTERLLTYAQLCARAAMLNTGWYTVNGGLFYYNAGDVVATLNAISQWTGLSRYKIRRHLEALEREGLIEIRGTYERGKHPLGPECPIPAGRCVRIVDIADEVTQAERSALSEQKQAA